MRTKLVILFLLAPCFAFANFYSCDRLRLPGWWGSLEYMVVWRKGRFYPPLVTFNPAEGSTPTLGSPGTEILFGGETYRDSPQSGVRGDVGLWFTECVGLGISGWAVGDENIRFSKGTEGIGSLARPFIDPAGTPRVLFISGVVGVDVNTGSIDIDAQNGIWGGDIYFRRPLFCQKVFRTDLLVGGMIAEMNDDLKISSTTLSEIPLDPSLDVFVRLDFFDNFCTSNNFYGAMIGILSELRTCNWALVFTGKIGLGSIDRKVDISGFSRVFGEGIEITEAPVGFLALPSNIGNYSDNGFQILPQLNLRGEFKICNNFWLTAGYTWIYWPRVALAGDQVDINLNLEQIVTLESMPPPVFNFQKTNFYIHSATVGLHLLF